MGVLNSALMAVSAISLAGCIVEPTSSRPPPLEYGRPLPPVEYDRRPPPRDFDHGPGPLGDREIHQQNEHEHDSRPHAEPDRGSRPHDDHDRNDRPPG